VDVLTPRSLDEALRLKAERSDAVPIQGGTDVMVELNFDRARPAVLLNLNEVAELRALNAPPGVQSALDRYLQYREQVVGLLKKALQAAQDENLQAYVKAQSASAAGQVRRTTLARAVGFSQCSRVSAQSGSK
jgi:hypothetical protein